MITLIQSTTALALHMQGRLPEAWRELTSETKKSHEDVQDSLQSGNQATLSPSIQLTEKDAGLRLASKGKDGGIRLAIEGRKRCHEGQKNTAEWPFCLSVYAEHQRKKMYIIFDVGVSNNVVRSHCFHGVPTLTK